MAAAQDKPQLINIDPKIAFTGRRFPNTSNICWLNSSINGLLSIRTVRDKIMSGANEFMLHLRSALNGNYFVAEPLRQLLQTFYGEIYEFTYGNQHYIGDSLSCLLEALQVKDLCSYDITVARNCLSCSYSHPESTTGMLYFLDLKSTTQEMIQGESISSVTECPKCHRACLHSEKVYMSNTKQFLLFGCSRPEGNEQSVYPSPLIRTADGKKYAIKSVINYYPGESADSGHYNTSIFYNEQWYMAQDSFEGQYNVQQMEDFPSNGLVFIYEQEDMLDTENDTPLNTIDG